MRLNWMVYFGSIWKTFLSQTFRVTSGLEAGNDLDTISAETPNFPELEYPNDQNDVTLHTSAPSKMQFFAINIDSVELNVCCSSKGLTTKLNIIIFLLTVASITCIVLFVVSNYIKQALIALEHGHSLLTFLCFLILFTFVSLPMTWGYVLLNLAAGYLYGVAVGMIIVFFCALFGITVAHFLINHSLKRCILAQISGNSSFRTLISVVESRHGFKVIALARLTPIPFGLQNALFALCRMNLSRYLSASAMGMIPTQGLHTYIGSTLRSMQDIVSSDQDNSLARAVFLAQFCLVVILVVFIVKKAKNEFNRTLQEAENVQLVTYV